jgi:hypothetical protein
MLENETARDTFALPSSLSVTTASKLDHLTVPLGARELGKLVLSSTSMEWKPPRYSRGSAPHEASAASELHLSKHPLVKGSCLWFQSETVQEGANGKTVQSFERRKDAASRDLRHVQPKESSEGDGK